MSIGGDLGGPGFPCTAGGLDAAPSPWARVAAPPDLDPSPTLSGHSPPAFAQGQWRWTLERLVPEHSQQLCGHSPKLDRTQMSIKLEVKKQTVLLPRRPTRKHDSHTLCGRMASHTFVSTFSQSEYVKVIQETLSEQKRCQSRTRPEILCTRHTPSGHFSSALEPQTEVLFYALTSQPDLW